MTRRDQVRALVVRSREAIILAAVVGGVTGLVVALFERITIEVALHNIRKLPWWIMPWAPFVGLTITAVLLHQGGKLTPSTSDEYIQDFHSRGTQLPLRPFLWRITAAVASLGSGVPGGLEGPSLYIGASIGTRIQQRFRRLLGPEGEKNLMVAGAAAGTAAIFRAPATGAVFALEVPYRDDLGRRLLMPSLIGGATGYLAFIAVNGTKDLIRVQGNAPFDFKDLLGAIVLGLGTGLLIRGYAWLLIQAKRFQRTQPAWLGVVLGGGVIGILGLISHEAFDANFAISPGYSAIAWIATPGRAIALVALLLAIRLAGTVAAVGAGGVIGLFVPLVVTGALFGRLVSEVVGVPNGSLFVIVGVAAALGAGYRVPLAAVMYVAEVTGRAGYVVPGLLAAVGADLLMGNASVTAFQQSSATVHEYH